MLSDPSARAVIWFVWTGAIACGVIVLRDREVMLELKLLGALVVVFLMALVSALAWGALYG